ncbi:uncharacterized protein EKO05_0006731 [Ascochyta rabiei]|uniref:uncharacterized protein n=1 Tax=Didymella rabiei TaxID=5454 RepID=UPI0021FF1F99|nr:uncharacterized protein EKO05_0006731 [Ascochyta rabiei]UPX16322.1 hypothetical protein EKO05_0006731 [Ascochyta rabiei]
MTPPPSHIARQALPDHVYQLPDNMQPQPSLSRYWCRGSVTRLTTHSKYNPKGTIESFMYVFRRPGGYGLRKDNFGVCAGCVEAKVGECVEIDPVFRRAVNMLDFLIDRALRKTNEETARQGDQATEDSVDNAVQSFWQTAYDYALGCRNGFVAYDAVVRRRVNKSGLSETEYAQARQVSWSHNLQRYIVSVVFLPSFLEADMSRLRSVRSARSCPTTWSSMPCSKSTSRRRVVRTRRRSAGTTMVLTCRRLPRLPLPPSRGYLRRPRSSLRVAVDAVAPPSK